ncbi:YraN family protein [Kroppenstedtia eburnea]|uniref:UPF0102 protein SAMN05421790_101579 n=1 Tax=Kroppenstedtia eburnea TaxID=714067 RepID=A0A1N7J0N8_9BACL|nr:YraN family protein [Kroppenstedtia eburnea]EGK13451.1 endonuclease [Desmospora sp. 8437]QKI82385.1 YraN family protein [Kroppenstedtia eburnea]SIS42816.1 putative endonuclease [Kroppenstedtia eburnea]
MSKDRRRETGQIGEALAARYLENKGYTILETNWRNRYGELDLIAEREGELVIVEVRTTRGRQYGYGFQSIDRRKQQQVRKLALAYLQSRQSQTASFRIDVVSVLLSPAGDPLRIDHLEAAF